MVPRSRPPLRLAAVLGCALLLTACASGGAGAQDTTLTSPAPTTTQVRAAAGTPTPAPPSPGTPSSASPLADVLVLHPGGLGNARFGDPPSVVVGAVSGVLGEPDEDSGWHAQADLQVHGACPGDFNRRVRWGQFVAVFTDGGTGFVPDGQEHFFTWAVSAWPAETAPRTTQAVTPDGIGVGSTLTELRAAFGARRVRVAPPVEPDLDHQRFSVVAGDGVTLSGLLTADGRKVLRLEAGVLCGE